MLGTELSAGVVASHKPAARSIPPSRKSIPVARTTITRHSVLCFSTIVHCAPFLSKELTDGLCADNWPWNYDSEAARLSLDCEAAFVGVDAPGTPIDLRSCDQFISRVPSCLQSGCRSL